MSTSEFLVLQYTARQSLRNGYHVYLGNRNLQKGRQAVDQLKSAGLNNVEPITIDVDDPDSIKAACEVPGPIE